MDDLGANMASHTELADHEMELLTWKHWFLRRVMSPSRLQDRCELDNGRHQRHISQNDNAIPDPLGAFSSLPAELFDAILEELDLQSLTVCRAVSWTFRDAIDDFTPYKSIITHCLDIMRALLCTYSASHYTARQIYSALCSQVCDECKQQFGPLLDLLSGRRCCMPCAIYSPNLLTFAQWRLKRTVDTLRANGVLNEANIDRDPPALHSIPGVYCAPYERKIKRRIWLVRVSPAMREELKLSEHSMHHETRNPFRTLPMLHIPFLDPRTGEPDWGRSCQGCNPDLRGHNDRYQDLHPSKYRLYSKSEYSEHFKECSRSQIARAAIPEFTAAMSSGELWKSETWWLIKQRFRIGRDPLLLQYLQVLGRLEVIR